MPDIKKDQWTYWLLSILINWFGIAYVFVSLAVDFANKYIQSLPSEESVNQSIETINVHPFGWDGILFVLIVVLLMSWTYFYQFAIFRRIPQMLMDNFSKKSNYPPMKSALIISLGIIIEFFLDVFLAWLFIYINYELPYNLLLTIGTIYGLGCTFLLGFGYQHFRKSINAVIKMVEFLEKSEKVEKDTKNPNKIRKKFKKKKHIE